MCFDIDVSKLSLQELRDTLRRITMLLSKPMVVNNLPDKGHQLRRSKQKLEKEIKFRESLEATHNQIMKMSLKCFSDSSIDTPHNTKLCSYDKKPERERFKPNLNRKPSTSGRTESMKELHSGTKLIDLVTSLSIQVEQEERVKGEQVKAKQNRLLAIFNRNNTGDSDSDETSTEHNLSDYISENDKQSQEEDAKTFYPDDEPGTSGLGRRKKLRKRPVDQEEKIQANVDSAKMKTEAVELKKESEDPGKIIQTSTVKSEKNIVPSGDKKMGEKPEETKTAANLAEPNDNDTEPMVNSTEPTKKLLDS